MAYAALVSWLITEGLGAWMLQRWLVSGGMRRVRAAGADVPPQVILGHAGLAATGFGCWVGYLASGSPVPAWLALGLLGPAIGLGISTVTIWTPYPVGRADGASASRDAEVRGPRDAGTDLARVLADEALTRRLVDELVADMLARQPQASGGRRRTAAALIPVAHGATALTTFLLVMLAVVTQAT